jgi:carbon storage regulator
VVKVVRGIVGGRERSPHSRQTSRREQMLVLSRKPSESVLIGSDVKITILKVERSHVRIGIEAPSEVTILRAELIEDGEGGWVAGNFEREPGPAVAAR